MFGWLRAARTPASRRNRALRFAHYHLGVALLRLGDRSRGREAIEKCLRLDPENRLARGWLQILLSPAEGSLDASAPAVGNSYKGGNAP
jgi:Tetratricopeptide repeat